MKVKDLSARLQGIIEYMRLSAESYDSGAVGEASRLAVCVKAFISEAGASAQGGRGFKDLSFHDESPDYKAALGLPFSGLAVVTIGKSAYRYAPRLGNNGRFRKVSFDEWWGRPVIVDAEKGVSLSRASIVEDAARTPGGPPDAKLDSEFMRLGLETPGFAGLRPINADMAQIESASVRQIAYEILTTLDESASGRS